MPTKAVSKPEDDRQYPYVEYHMTSDIPIRIHVKDGAEARHVASLYMAANTKAPDASVSIHTKKDVSTFSRNSEGYWVVLRAIR